ncbi:MAG: lamin tail domain-containing protein [Myxococcota bacterium]|nr:lamin tail domain-containing protein [Myxococcota bacterium]
MRSLVLFTLVACGLERNMETPVDLAFLEAERARANTPTPPKGEGPLIINEVAPNDPEYVEIMNRSDSIFSLAGYQLCDSKDGESPDLTDGLLFPFDLQLEPGERLLVHSGQDLVASGTWMSPCPVVETTRCLSAEWSLSASRGEPVFLVNADEDIVDWAKPPANVLNATRAWARIPDGSGGFELSNRSPGSNNTESP